MRLSVILSFLAAVIVIASYPASAHEQIPAPPQNRPVALVGGTIHTVAGWDIEGGTVVFDKGVITAMGNDVAVPDNAERIDITGKHVYPALIEAYSHLGLTEIDAVRATVDFIETGDINPNIRAEMAVNADSERIPITRSNGVAIAGTIPEGGLISGQAAVIMLDGWTWEDMTLKSSAGMVINWPSMPVTAVAGMQKSGDEARKKIEERIDLLEKAFKDARAYMTAREAAEKDDVPFHRSDIRWDAMIPVLKGEEPVMIMANSLAEIESAVEWADRAGVKMTLVGGADAPLAADLLQKRDIPVIVSTVLRLPERRHSTYDEPFTLAKRLHDMGIRFCIAGDSGAGNERNLPYHAAMAAAFGLSKDQALKSVTLYAAEILGIADRVGSIAIGKDATLIVTDGDPLEITTVVEQLFIQGRNVDLDNRQKALYRKYTEKYQRGASH